MYDPDLPEIVGSRNPGDIAPQSPPKGETQMRILKALAVLLAGILLLALPAVAMPQAPEDPEECVAAEEAPAEEAEEAGVEQTAAPEEPADPCAEQDQGDALSSLGEALGLPGLP